MQFLFLFIVSYFLFIPAVFAQNEVETYLKTHFYGFVPEAGFDSLPTLKLKKAFEKYTFVLQAEFGSHELEMQDKLLNMWLNFFVAHKNLQHFVIEYGHSTAYLMNVEYQAGKQVQYPYTLTHNGKMPQAVGIDFERPKSFAQALPYLLPTSPAPPSIAEAVEYARKLSEKTENWQIHCELLQDILKKLRISWQANEDVWKAYIGKNVFAWERILWNKGTCQQFIGGYRDKNMAENFLAYHTHTQDTFYYGQMGQGHTAWLPRKFPTIIASHPTFEDQVAVIGGYCYECQEAGKVLQNGLDKKVEADILQYCLPLCKSEFTLFDLSEAPSALKRLKSLGTFLIIAKRQIVQKH